jgi:hypothetical protein
MEPLSFSSKLNGLFYSALIKLLYECAGSSTPSPRFVELVMKCLWKVVKMFPGWEAETDYDMVLYDIHLFLKVGTLLYVTLHSHASY